MILYLGLDPSRFPHPVFHYPIIELKPLAIVEPPHSHILFTSPSAVKLYPAIQSPVTLSIGSATSSVLKERGIDPIEAPFATQEGVIELLKTLSIDFLFWPRSSRARPLLKNYLEANHIPHLITDLYQTVSRIPLAPIDWKAFSSIIFTSPSTVDAFFEIYGELPSSEKAVPIGPVTAEYLLKKRSYPVFS